ncbi:MAG: hypothetical protein PHG35_03500 [Dehalococcoidales bacterium]|nr:hypothetical protein [Dehalococcoidales bacterium]
MPEPAQDVTLKDVEASIAHVQAVRNGTVTVTIQDGVILEVVETAITRRKKAK